MMARAMSAQGRSAAALTTSRDNQHYCPESIGGFSSRLSGKGSEKLS